MREQKYHVYLTAEEQSRVIQSLIRLKNELLEQGKYTDYLSPFKAFYLYRTLSGMGDFFSKENYPKGTPSLFNNDCSDDGFLDARSYV